jgi:hypothetical protein
LIEHGDGQLHALAAIANSGAQKQRAEMLLDGARADIELARDFFIAAALNQQFQDLPVTGRHFDLIQIHHDNLPRFSRFVFFVFRLVCFDLAESHPSVN